MQRQSLGSPGSKQHTSHGVVVVDGGGSSAAPAAEEEEERKPLKRVGRAEKYVHFIPVLTLLCFLILYLFSHHPSHNDLAQFNGFEAFSKSIESGDIDDIQRVSEIERGDVLAIRSMRNLREIERDNSKRKVHRKIADF